MQPTHLLVTVSLVALASAWNPPASPPTIQKGDACSLLTTAQVSAALGTGVEAGKPIVASNPKICGWAPPGGPKIDGKKLTLTLITLQSFDNGKKPLQGIEKVPLSGVGDDAIYITTGGFGTALNVKKGSGGFQVRVGGFKKDQEMQVEKTLALEVLKKL
jgi:hypothetical protein